MCLSRLSHDGPTLPPHLRLWSDLEISLSSHEQSASAVTLVSQCIFRHEGQFRHLSSHLLTFIFLLIEFQVHSFSLNHSKKEGLSQLF